MTEKHFKKSEETWNEIAESFDATRRKPWQEVVDFINGLSSSDVVADIGCGNGRHLILCVDKCKVVVGLDISRNLLKITRNKMETKKISAVFIHGNLVDIPLKDNSLDTVLYIASLHNIKGREERIRSLKEVRRILKKDGRALISVWSRWQDKYRMHFLKELFTHKGEFGDIEIYWRQHNLDIPRFYHLYSKKEFISDINKSRFEIERSYSVKLHSKKYHDNYFVVARKEKS